MKKLTKQTAYEKVREYFSRPGAVFGWDVKRRKCVYRGRPSRSLTYSVTSPIRCGIGCLIPNVLYKSIGPAIENINVDGIFSHINELFDPFEQYMRIFLRDIQDAHDDEASENDPSLTRFIKRLDKIAKRYGLEVVKA